MATQQMHEIYTDQLRNHSEGHALWFRETDKRLKPGSCGFFNERGAWELIAQTADVPPETLTAAGWARPPAPIRMKPRSGGREWPIKRSESVSRINVTANARVNVPTAPVSGGFTMEFGTERGAGAILITAGTVYLHELERDLLALQWVIDPPNMRKILEEWPEVSTNGRTLWMITATYTVKTCAKHVINSPQASAKIGIDVDAGPATASPSAEWWMQRTDQAWEKHYTEPGDDGIVVFLSGISFATSIFKRSKLVAERRRLKQHLYRAAPTVAMEYPLHAYRMEPDPLVALVVPKYDGKSALELEAYLESLVSAKEDDEESAEVNGDDDIF